MVVKNKKNIKKSILIQSKIDPDLKLKSEKILDELGLNMSRAIEVFLRQVVVRRGLPFEVVLKSGEDSGILLSQANLKGGQKWEGLDELLKDTKARKNISNE